jgi:outer membrane protein assembly factor BamB
MRWRQFKALALTSSVLAALVLALQSSPVLAQNATIAWSSASGPNDINQPFLLSSVPSEVVESIANYQRYCGRAQWEKAFKQLDTLASTKASGLVPGPDGVMVPPSQLVVRLISDLPADGKKAFQLFYDADAKSLLDQAQGSVEEEKLASVATRYLFTASGDAAADRWGDLCFEKGDFARAAAAWRSVLNHRPDTTIAAPQLLIKVAIALARANRWSEFAELKQQIMERHPDASVMLGGKSIHVADELKSLAAGEPSKSTTVSSNSPANAKVHLVADAQPLWQFRWFAQVNPILGNREGLVVYDQMYGRQYASDFVPPTSVDGARLYSDLVGYDVGIDLNTGKLSWRSGRFFDLTKSDNNQNQMMRGMVLERSGILCGNDRVWTVARDSGNQNQNDPRYFLVARELSTGKELYNSKNAKDGAKDWTMTGSPVSDETHLYIGAYKPNQPTEVHVLCLNAADGKLLWNTKVGAYKNDPRQQYSYSTNRTTIPSLLLAGGSLYIDTHAGSLVQMSPTTGEIAWGMNYDSEMPSTDRYYNQPPEQFTAGAPLMMNGALYFKGMRSRRLYAVDPAGPKVLWSRPVAMNAVLSGVDRERIYLGGPEISAYDLKTQQLLWSKHVPEGTSWIHPLMTEDRIFQFTPRGIYEIDKQSGDIVRLFRGADMDSLGGNLLLTPKALVAISNLAITAYPIEPAVESTGANPAAKAESP